MSSCIFHVSCYFVNALVRLLTAFLYAREPFALRILLSCHFFNVKAQVVETISHVLDVASDSAVVFAGIVVFFLAVSRCA